MKNDLVFRRITDSMENLVRSMNITINYLADTIKTIQEYHPDKRLVKVTESLVKECRKTQKKYEAALTEIKNQSAILSLYLTLYQLKIQPELIRYFEIVHEVEAENNKPEVDIDKIKAKVVELINVKRNIEIDLLDLIHHFAGL
ncbi:MAG: hypothetical protein FJ149_04975 [Euryarchaeota archaeon]|nr:hypothetical protein [Euryarchaeota archaeon]